MTKKPERPSVPWLVGIIYAYLRGYLHSNGWTVGGGDLWERDDGLLFEVRGRRFRITVVEE